MTPAALKACPATAGFLFDPATPPAVVLGGINVVRSAGLAGIPVIVAASDPAEPAFASRYCSARYLLPPLADEAGVVASLERLAAPFAMRLPLIFGNDDYLRIIYGRRERFERRFLMLLNDPPVGAALIDKEAFARFALERGLPVPRGLRWDALAGTAGPVLIKPKVKFEWENSPVLAQLFEGAGKAIVRPSGAAVVADEAIARFRDQLLFQEYIPGGDDALWCFDGVADERGVLLASYVGRKIRSWPPRTGDSSYIELVHDAGVHALGRRVAEAAGLKGIFNVDLKRDPRDGSLRVLEINARYNFWLYLGAKNGLNLTKVMVDYLVARKHPAHLGYSTAYRWLDPELDLRAYRSLARADELTLARWIASLVFARKIYSVFSWSDPAPFLQAWGERIARRWTRGTQRLRQMLSKSS